MLIVSPNATPSNYIDIYISSIGLSRHCIRVHQRHYSSMIDNAGFNEQNVHSRSDDELESRFRAALAKMLLPLLFLVPYLVSTIFPGSDNNFLFYYSLDVMQR